MDFDLDEGQSDLRDLAAGLLDRIAADPHAPSPQDAAYDVAAWKAMAQAGLLDGCLPADVGGAGAGAVGLAVLLREVGAHVTRVPAVATLALGAFPIARHGTRSQRALLSTVADGELLLTAALREPGNLGPPRTVARRSGTGYVLDGVKTAVPYAREAAFVLVPATVPGAGVGVFLVPPDAGGISHQVHPTATGEPAGRLGLDLVRVDGDALLGGRLDGVAAADLDRHAVAGAVATVSGVLAGALRLTAEHVKTRSQFARPLAQFQAVTMQIADVYITGRALDVAMWAACWRLDVRGEPVGDEPGRGERVRGEPVGDERVRGEPVAGEPGLGDNEDDTDELLAVAAWHAAGPALRALYTCQHLHGGLGLDVTYPLHRYFAWAMQYAHMLGGERARLDILSNLLAAKAARATASAEG